MPFLPVSATAPRAHTSGFQECPKAKPAVTTITLKSLLPCASSFAKYNPTMPSPPEHMVFSQCTQAQPLHRPAAIVSQYAESSPSGTDYFSKPMLQSNRVVSAAETCQQWTSPSFPATNPFCSSGPYDFRPNVSADLILGQSSNGVQGRGHGGNGFNTATQVMPSLSPVPLHFDDFRHSADDAAQRVKEGGGNDGLEARNDKGSLSPTSWDNAFGEDEEFWMRLG
jgi:hypothetical protein